MKALWGNSAPVYADQVEFVDGDFASGFGPGGVLGTKFTWPTSKNKEYILTPEKQKHWKKWMDLYREKMLSKGEYLNLYDIAYDVPESHVIAKGDTLYYAFYAGSWKGKIELKGLQNTDYEVVNYVSTRQLGKVSLKEPFIDTEFTEYLLIECIPVK